MTIHRRGGRYFRVARTVLHHDAHRLSEGGQNRAPEALWR
jgi:hypothetical protein